MAQVLFLNGPLPLRILPAWPWQIRAPFEGPILCSWFTAVLVLWLPDLTLHSLLCQSVQVLWLSVQKKRETLFRGNGGRKHKRSITFTKERKTWNLLQVTTLDVRLTGRYRWMLRDPLYLLCELVMMTTTTGVLTITKKYFYYYILLLRCDIWHIYAL